MAISADGAALTVEPLPVVQGNEVHLVRLFENLISNAAKYRSARPITIRVGAEQFGRHWIIRIQDNGIGIAPKDCNRIFVPLLRLANSDVPGTGLGLAVCKKIGGEWGGAIWVEFELGVGSTFCFTIEAQEVKE